MNYTIVILGVIVVILIYILYRYFSTSSSTLKTKADLNKVQPPIPITNATSVRYAYGVWVYVNSFTGGKYKPIFQLPTSAPTISDATNVMTGNNIQLYLDKTTPTLYCDILTGTGANITKQIQITPNFPLQTWVYVVISVDNNYADFYLNGKLIKSIQLAGRQTQITAATPQIFIGDTSAVDIQIAGFYRWSKPLNPQEVWSNYLAGNGNPMSSMVSSFGMNVALVKDNIEQSKFALI